MNNEMTDNGDIPVTNAHKQEELICEGSENFLQHSRIRDQWVGR